MRYVLILSLVLTGLLSTPNAQMQPAPPQPTPPSTGPAATATATPTKVPPFEKQLKQSVTFVQLTCTKDNVPETVLGTGFFVGVLDERLGKDRGFSYLATNRHVALCWDERNHPMEVKSVSIRLNMKDGSSRVAVLSSTGNVPWILPADDSVDLAVLPLALDPEKVDFRVVGPQDFATDEVIAARDIAEGTKIAFSGYFYQFPGERKMQPIVREGIVAMMPDEDLTTTTGKPGKVYLGDVHIFHGNSGSPVFANVGGTRGGVISGDQYVFLGVVSGMYSEDEDFRLEVTTTVRGTARANSGIAMIVPATFLKQLLDGPQAQRQRDSVVASLNQHK